VLGVKKMVKTKIICTIGPASNSSVVIRKMALVGMDCVRLNFSHGTHTEHSKVIQIVRDFNKRHRRRIRILGDLEGYRIRVGKLSHPIELEKRKVLWLVQKDIIGDKDLIPFDCNCWLRNILPGQFIYINDGNIALRIKKVERKKIKTEVLVGGRLSTHKGINIPDADLRFQSLTEKDKKDLEFCIENKIDFIAQSFVRNKSDILRIKTFVLPKLSNCRIIAKIESQKSLKNLEGIISVSDGIMVARGDLGVCIPVYQVPIIQKIIIKKCREKKKFVITATHMLESMTEHITPTRAEVTDIANAILDGTDYVMLSAETAVGRYPTEAAKMMNQVIEFTESSSFYKEKVL